MSQSVAVRKNFRFVGGLNTEGGPLSFPPNTWQDGDNVIPNIDGKLARRHGLNYESGYSIASAYVTPSVEQTGAFRCQEWTNVGGDGGLNFVVVQRYNTLYFYTNDDDALSPNEQAFTVDLTSHLAPGNPNGAGIAPISAVSVNGKLLVVSSDTDPFLISYDADTDDISTADVTLQIRDLYGVVDGLAVDERPLTLSSEHNYNLLNQGWTADHIATYLAADALYPSNAQTWTTGKDSSDVFQAALLDKQDFGTSPAPKGRFVLDLFVRNRSAVSAVADVATERELYRPTTAAFFAGRAWYAGVSSNDIGSWVMFSQVADLTERYGRCYQDADPSSEFISDLVDSDGGVIPIQGASTIVKLLPVYNGLLVFADNGVWQIVGSSDTGFSATAYEVKKLSAVGCSSASSVVEADNNVFYWSDDGIWVVRPNEQGIITVTNTTEGTIQTTYNAIAPNARTYASGLYDGTAKVLYWLFNSDTAASAVTERFKKDRLLCLDLRLRAWYTHTINSLVSNSPYVLDLVVTKARTVVSTTLNVVTSTDDSVVDASSNTVVATTSVAQSAVPELRFLTLVPQASGAEWHTTFSAFEDGSVVASSWRDWYTADTAGVAVVPYIVTGYDLGQDQGGDKAVQALYALVFASRTETGVDSAGDAINASSIMLQARWDWTDNTISGKWSTSEQVYRHRRMWQPDVPSATYVDGYPVVTSKSKIRGRGKALQLAFTGADNKDFQLYGWALTFIGNKNV